MRLKRQHLIKRGARERKSLSDSIRGAHLLAGGCCAYRIVPISAMNAAAAGPERDEHSNDANEVIDRLCPAAALPATYVTIATNRRRDRPNRKAMRPFKF